MFITSSFKKSLIVEQFQGNYLKYNLRDKLDITEVIDIFTCENIISSHVRMYRFYQFVTTRYTTDFYIIKSLLFIQKCL